MIFCPVISSPAIFISFSALRLIFLPVPEVIFFLTSSPASPEISTFPPASISPKVSLNSSVLPPSEVSAFPNMYISPLAVAVISFLSEEVFFILNCPPFESPILPPAVKVIFPLSVLIYPNSLGTLTIPAVEFNTISFPEYIDATCISPFST